MAGTSLGLTMQDHTHKTTTTPATPEGEGSSRLEQQSQGQRVGFQKKVYVKKVRVDLSWDEFVTGTIATGFEMAESF